MATPFSSPLTRKRRKELTRRLQAADAGLEVMHPNAAGIDVGNSRVARERERAVGGVVAFGAT